MPERITDQIAACLVVCMLALMTSACGGSREAEAEHADTTLTPSQLEGRWCYAYIDFGSQREEIATEYEFNIDGTLEYQVSRLSDRMGSGSYAIERDQMDITPTLVMFDLLIADVGDDAFVLDAMGGKHHFLRGHCARHGLGTS